MSLGDTVGDMLLAEVRAMADGAGFSTSAPASEKNETSFIGRCGNTIRRELFAASPKTVGDAIKIVHGVFEKDVAANKCSPNEYWVSFDAEPGAPDTDAEADKSKTPEALKAAADKSQKAAITAKKRMTRAGDKYAPYTAAECTKFLETAGSDKTIEMPSELRLIATNSDDARKVMWRGVNTLIEYALATLEVKAKVIVRVVCNTNDGAETHAYECQPGTPKKRELAEPAIKLASVAKTSGGRMLHRMMLHFRQANRNYIAQEGSVGSFSRQRGTLCFSSAFYLPTAMLLVPLLVHNGAKYFPRLFYFSDSAGAAPATADADDDEELADAKKPAAAAASKNATEKTYIDLFAAVHRIAKRSSESKIGRWNGVSNPIATLEFFSALLGGWFESFDDMDAGSAFPAGAMLKTLLVDSPHSADGWSCVNPLRKNNAVQVEYVDPGADTQNNRMRTPRRSYVDEDAAVDVLLRVIAFRMSRRVKEGKDIFEKVCRYLDGKSTAKEGAVQSALEYMQMRELRDFTERDKETQKAFRERDAEIKVWEKKDEVAWKAAYPDRDRPGRKPVQKSKETSHDFRAPGTTEALRSRVRRAMWSLVSSTNCHVLGGSPSQTLAVDGLSVWGWPKSVKIFDTRRNLDDNFYPMLKPAKTK